MNQGTNVDVAELGLCLALELGIGKTDADDGCKTLADVLAFEVVIVVLQEATVSGISVEDPCEGAAETLFVHASLDGVDAVGERMEAVGVETGVPLERQLNLVSILVLVEVPDQ